MIHIYTGDGKGKTTAACGLALRSAGCGKNVLVVQFLKDGTSGEMCAFENFKNITVMSSETKGFLWNMTDRERQETKELHEKLFKTAMQKASDFDVVIFDEILGAISTGMIGETAVFEFLKTNPEPEIVLTGRGASEKLIHLADYVSEIKCVKHPMEKGIPARKGIEY